MLSALRSDRLDEAEPLFRNARSELVRPTRFAIIFPINPLNIQIITHPTLPLADVSPLERPHAVGRARMKRNRLWPHTAQST